MGRSFRTDRPVIDLIKERYAATIELALAALLIAIIIAIPLGVVAGKNRGSWIDNLASVVSLWSESVCPVSLSVRCWSMCSR